MPNKEHIAAIIALDHKRVAAGLCRHCGNELPCHSPYGDFAPGKRHTRESWTPPSGPRAPILAPWGWV